MSATFRCAICNIIVPRTELEAHIVERHSDPNPNPRVVGGEPIELTDADYVRMTIDDKSLQPEVVGPPATVAPVASIFDEIGVKLSDFEHPAITTETGGECTAAEAKRVFTAIDTFAGWRVDRAAFIVNFLDWGFRNSFTEEIAEAGGFVLRQEPTAGQNSAFFTVATMHAAILDAFSAAGTGRSFTFRRLGRFFGRSIPSIIDKNPGLRRYYTVGTPVSNRFGVAPQHFLTVTSIFEYIKPFQKWTKDELAAWTAFNKAVTKVAKEQNRDFAPQDLRPQPSQASTLVDRNLDDFSKRHGASNRGVDVVADYGRGKEMFEKMLSSGQTDRSGLGY
ncbi:putative coat protein [Acidomyces richmondensis tobamo-like virus 1]|nr:putative coat protein [Acidomyces richmondensis tobamo-like virus 1]